MEDDISRNQVTVTVDANGAIACTPDPVHARGPSALLKFELRAAGYVFPQTGAVVIDDASPQFPQPSRTVPPGNTTATLLDLNTQSGTFKYTVTVQQTDTGRLLSFDPTVRNEP